jgi:EAL domain-containing protein (putative c-di-GMP-specific phosphodiesterase class I)/putative methionine-R-sulfoxide reductase with GAF domain
MNSVGLDEMAGKLIPEFMDELNADGGSVLVGHDNVLVVKTAFGLKKNRAHQARIPYGVGVTGRAVESNAIQWLPDVEEVENHIEGIPNSRWELTIPLTHPDRFASVVVDFESSTRNRPSEAVRRRVIDELEQLKLPILNRAENNWLREDYRSDSMSVLMSQDYFLKNLDDWFEDSPQETGILLVFELEPRIEDTQISTLRDLEKEVAGIGAKLNSVLSQNTVAARLYGNLFALFVPDETPETITDVRERVSSELQSVCKIRQMNSTPVVETDSVAEDVLNSAFVSLDLTNDVTTHRQSESLDNILRKGNIELVEQPILQAESETLIGREVLVRGPDSTPLSSPKRLFETAYQEDRVVELDTLILRKTLSSFNGNTEGQLFVNVERQSVDETEWRELFVELLRDSANHLDVCLEITEHGNLTELKDPLQELRERLDSKLSFAIDDFGTGSANFSAIIDLDPDIIKIDRSLIRHVDDDFGKRSMIESIVNFSSTTDITVLAEGIEDRQEKETLEGLGVDWVQGFHFARPSGVMESKTWT